MRSADLPSPPVVAGIDGSHSALMAALWAVDEAADRNVPLRLVYAVEPRDAWMPDPQRDAGDLASADIAVRSAIVAIQSRELPVKIEVEIRQQPALATFRELSYSAAIVCIGATGNNLATGSQLGSVAIGLASTAHCAVAIVRGEEHSGAILVETDNVGNETLLERGVQEALLRNVPLHVVTRHFSPTTDSSRLTDAETPRPATPGLVNTQLESRLAYWRRRYPRLQVDVVPTQMTLIEYLRKQSGQVQLVVAGRNRGDGLSELIGPAANATFHATNCSLLICGQHGAL